VSAKNKTSDGGLLLLLVREGFSRMQQSALINQALNIVCVRVCHWINKRERAGARTSSRLRRKVNGF
jgi:hypothetical protein